MDWFVFLESGKRFADKIHYVAVQTDGYFCNTCKNSGCLTCCKGVWRNALKGLVFLDIDDFGVCW